MERGPGLRTGEAFVSDRDRAVGDAGRDQISGQGIRGTVAGAGRVRGPLTVAAASQAIPVLAREPSTGETCIAITAGSSSIVAGGTMPTPLSLEAGGRGAKPGSKSSPRVPSALVSQFASRGDDRGRVLGRLPEPEERAGNGVRAEPCLGPRQLNDAAGGIAWAASRGWRRVARGHMLRAFKGVTEPPHPVLIPSVHGSADHGDFGDRKPAQVDGCGYPGRGASV
jgi:hypothetical protein